MFAYEPYRRKALGLSTLQQKKLAAASAPKIKSMVVDKTRLIPPAETPTSSSASSSQKQRGRVKQIPRVMRNVTGKSL